MKLKTVAPVCLLVALSACTFSTKDIGKVDYKAGAQQRPTALDVPPDLTSPGRDDRYALDGEGAVAAATLSEFQAGRKPAGAGGIAPATGPLVLPDVAQMSIGRAGSERWLVVPLTPTQAYAKVKGFWLQNSFPLVVDRPELGILETDWVENRAKIKQDIIRDTVGKYLDGMYTSPERDRYRTRIEPGAKPGTVDIFISHRGIEEVVTGGVQQDSSVWTWRKSDPGMEAEMLRRMMLAFGVSEDRARDLLASSPATERARFERAADGGAALVLTGSIDDAWRQVGLALDRNGLLVEDRDRTVGLFDVRVAGVKPEESKSSWLDKLAFWKTTAPASSPVASLKPGLAYRVFVNGSEKSSVVRVLDADGNIDKGEEASKILKLLYESLK
ncbi:outer membrane protein assembly factor BamC [Niveibacterium sp. 24ML]|uniref:outer membrane protein assembly factor BamC n=1 Tax=Niveibacterium sp. 24ML TaxID=2985512 RepID=UPI00227200F8|nr:outer membrane protein assembly factor BamC [Niveibacterium sp. 24ML]MCX9156063.1 outer membrane protein assembly factor BamC [Niveibacterium sp. 24ML]